MPLCSLKDRSPALSWPWPDSPGLPFTAAFLCSSSCSLLLIDAHLYSTFHHPNIHHCLFNTFSSSSLVTFSICSSVLGNVELLLPPFAVRRLAPCVSLMAHTSYRGADRPPVATLLSLFPPFLHVNFAILYTFLHLLIGLLFIPAHSIRLSKAVTSWSGGARNAVSSPPI